jgi:hypothetical protein
VLQSTYYCQWQDWIPSVTYLAKFLKIFGQNMAIEKSEKKHLILARLNLKKKKLSGYIYTYSQSKTEDQCCVVI